MIYNNVPGNQFFDGFQDAHRCVTAQRFVRVATVFGRIGDTNQAATALTAGQPAEAFPEKVQENVGCRK